MSRTEIESEIVDCVARLYRELTGLEAEPASVLQCLRDADEESSSNRSLGSTGGRGLASTVDLVGEVARTVLIGGTPLLGISLGLAASGPVLSLVAHVVLTGVNVFRKSVLLEGDGLRTGVALRNLRLEARRRGQRNPWFDVPTIAEKAGLTDEDCRVALKALQTKETIYGATIIDVVQVNDQGQYRLKPEI